MNLKSVLEELLSKIKSKCTQYFNVSGNFALTYILAIFFGHIITFLFFSSFFNQTYTEDQIWEMMDYAFIVSF